LAVNISHAVEGTPPRTAANALGLPKETAAPKKKPPLKQGQAAFIEAGTDYRVHGMQEGYAVLAGLPI